MQYILYYKGAYLKFNRHEEIKTKVQTNGSRIELKDEEGKYEEWVIKGVDLNSSIPGHQLTEFAINEETYLRWFKWIQEMGANTIRIPGIMDDTFYNAFYSYNTQNDEPLYLLQGISIIDYANNNRFDAYSKQFYEALKRDATTAIDIIHGKKNTFFNKDIGSSRYGKNISEWVLGYVLMAEWNADTIAYTNHNGHPTQYNGKYVKTTSDATAFEVMIAEIFDSIITYESEWYGEQRLVSFMNSPLTDPFEYDIHYAKQLGKHTQLDAEHLIMKDIFKAGYFASYRVYEFCEDFYNYFSPEQKSILGNALHIGVEDLVYDGYTKLLNNYHTMPIVVSYGFSSARGIDEGVPLSELEQGKSLMKAYEDFIATGSSGVIISSWQDSWGQSTWNTSYATMLGNGHYWNDIQSSNQGKGLLSFDPGEGESICYVDGDSSEWSKKDIVMSYDHMQLSAKYDERGIYLLIEGEGVKRDETIYIPIDTTDKTGSQSSSEYGIKFDRDVDFLLVLDGQDNTRLLVQKRYESIRANYSIETTGIDAYVEVPEEDTQEFVPINMILNTQNLIPPDTTYEEVNEQLLADVFETGKLHYGNGNPASEKFDSLADFCYGDNVVEIRIPWQLLNFSDPSYMKIHDDYYLNYGVESINLKSFYIGIAKESIAKQASIPMEELKLKKWTSTVTYHERLKQSYYIMQQLWRGEE